MQEFPQVSIQFIEQQLKKTNWEDELAKLQNMFSFKFEIDRLLNSAMFPLVKLFYHLGMKIVIVKAYGHLVRYNQKYHQPAAKQSRQKQKQKSYQVQNQEIEQQVIEISKKLKTLYCKIINKIKQNRKVQIMDIIIFIFSLISRSVFLFFFQNTKNRSNIVINNKNSKTVVNLQTLSSVQTSKTLTNIKKKKIIQQNIDNSIIIPSNGINKVKFDIQQDSSLVRSGKNNYRKQCTSKNIVQAPSYSYKEEDMLTIQQYSFIIITYQTTGNLVNPYSFNFIKKKYINKDKQNRKEKIRQRQRQKSIVVQSLSYIKDQVVKTKKFIDFIRKQSKQKQNLIQKQQKPQNTQLQDYLRSALKIFQNYDHYQVNLDRKQDYVSKILHQLLQKRNNQNKTTISNKPENKLSEQKSQLSLSSKFKFISTSEHNQKESQQKQVKMNKKTHQKHRSFTKLQKITQKTLSKATKYFYNIKQKDLSLLQRTRQKTQQQQSLLEKNRKVKYWKQVKSISKPIFYINYKSNNQDCFVLQKPNKINWNEVISDLKRKLTKDQIVIQKFKANSLIIGNTKRSQKQNFFGISQKQYLKFCQKKANQCKNKSQSCHVSFDKKTIQQKKIDKQIQIHQDKQIHSKKSLKQQGLSTKQKVSTKSIQKPTESGNQQPNLPLILNKKYQNILDIKIASQDAYKYQIQTQTQSDVKKLKKKTIDIKKKKKQFQLKCKYRRNVIDGSQILRQQ